jgi:Zn-dependent peptidase ImmA (M78 family)
MPLLGPCQLCGAEQSVSLAEEEQEPPEASGRPARAPDPRADARAAAAALLAELGIEKPPVGVVGIAAALGTRVSYVPLGAVSGELREGRILINRDHHRLRRRFTIAHEIGHLRLHAERGGRDSEAERQADVFAATLLIPPPMLREAAASGADLAGLCRFFEVSRPAIGIALEEANLRL